MDRRKECVIDLHKVVPLILFLMSPFVVRMRENQALAQIEFCSYQPTNADADPDLTSKPKMGRNHKWKLKPK